MELCDDDYVITLFVVLTLHVLKMLSGERRVNIDAWISQGKFIIIFIKKISLILWKWKNTKFSKGKSVLSQVILTKTYSSNELIQFK